MKKKNHVQSAIVSSTNNWDERLMKLQLLFDCLSSVPKWPCAKEEMMCIFLSFAAWLKNVGYQMKRHQSRCKMLELLFFFFAGMQRLEKTLFLCTYWRWGNENNMEWMQGLRAPCPACTDESQRPDLIHTPGSNEQKLVHTCRKVLIHAQSPQKSACFA